MFRNVNNIRPNFIFISVYFAAQVLNMRTLWR